MSGQELSADGKKPVAHPAKPPLTMAQVGRRCTVLALGIDFIAGVVVFTALYPPSHPGADTTGEAIFTVFDMAAVGASVSLGLAFAAPRIPAIVRDGLRTAEGGVLAALIGLGQLALVGLLLGGIVSRSGMSVSANEWLRLASATVLPGLGASVVALAMFDRFALPRRAARVRGVLGAAIVAMLVGTAISAVGQRIAFALLLRQYHWYSDAGSLAVPTALFLGLCIAVPLVPRTIEGGLVRPAGLTLIAAIFAMEYVFMDALSGQYFAIDFSVGEPAILIVAFAATAIALVVFDRLMAGQKAEQAGRHLPAEH